MGQWILNSDPVDVMNAMNSDCPSKPFGIFYFNFYFIIILIIYAFQILLGGAEEFDLSPDLKTMAITTQAHQAIAWTTDLNVILIDLQTLTPQVKLYIFIKFIHLYIL